MADQDLVFYRSSIPASGYEWKEWLYLRFTGGKIKDWGLSAKSAPLGLTAPRWVHPLRQSPALFREFASLDMTSREKILNFANTYGWLGAYLGDPIEPHASLWAVKIAEMRRATDLWSRITAGDTAGIAAHLRPRPAGWRWPDNPEVERQRIGPLWRTHDAGDDLGLYDEWLYDSHPDLAPEATPAWGGREILLFPVPASGGGLPAAATELLFWWINSRLISPLPLNVEMQQAGYSRTPPPLQGAPESSASDQTGEMGYSIGTSMRGYESVADLQVSLRIAWGASGKPVMRWTPASLLTALWLQFALAVTGNKQFRTCAVCGGWFEVDTRDGRKGKQIFCGDNCKTRDYRKRRDRVAALKAEGLSVPRIGERLKAEGLETDPETVKKWAGAKKT